MPLKPGNKFLGPIDLTRTDANHQVGMHSLLDPMILKHAEKRLGPKDKWVEALPAATFLVVRDGSPYLHLPSPHHVGAQRVYGVLLKRVVVGIAGGGDHPSNSSMEFTVGGEVAQYYVVGDNVFFLGVAIPPYVRLYTKNYEPEVKGWGMSNKLYVTPNGLLDSVPSAGDNIVLAGGVLQVPTKEDPYLGVQVFL